jgi:hypothetical protein
VPDGLVVFDATTSRFVDLNDSAARLWMVLDGVGWDEAAAAEALRSRFAVAQAESEQLVAGFIEELSELALISR